MTTDQVKQKIQQARSQGVPDKEIFNYLNNKGLIPSEKVVQSAPVSVQESPTKSVVGTLAAPMREGFQGLKTLYGGGEQGIANKLKQDVIEGAKDIQSGNVVKGVAKAGFRTAGDVAGAIYAPVGAALQATGVNKIFDYLGELSQKGGKYNPLNLITDSKMVQDFVMARPNLEEDFGRALNLASTKLETGKIEPSTVIPRTIAQVESGIAKTKAIPGQVIQKTKSITGRLPEDIVNKRVAELENISGNYAQLRKETNFNPERAKESVKRVASTDVLSNAVDENGLIRTKQPGGAVDEYKAQTLDHAENVVRKNLERLKETVNLDEVQIRLENAVNSSGLEGADLKIALNKVKREISGYKLKADAEGNIPLTLVHDAKIATTKKIRDFTTPSEIKTYEKAIGEGLKQTVEKNSTFNVKEVNGELSKYLQDIKFLEQLDGKRVKGGKLGKYFAQISGNIVGGTIGGAIGGPVGSGMGTIIGGEIASKIKGNSLSKTLSGKTGYTAPKNPIIEKAIQSADQSNNLGNRNAQYQTPNITSKIEPINQINKVTNKAIPASTNNTSNLTISKTIPQKIKGAVDKVLKVMNSDKGIMRVINSKKGSVSISNPLYKDTKAVRLTPELKDTISKELVNYDNKVLGIRGKKAAWAVPDDVKDTRIIELQRKIESKSLNDIEFKEAYELLKAKGIDVTNPKSAPKSTTFKQNPATGKLEGSIPATQSKLIQEAKKYKSAEQLKGNYKNPLYHDTTAGGIKGILTDGQIDTAYVPFGGEKSVSFTANPENYSRMKAPFRIIVDDTKKSATFMNDIEAEHVFRNPVPLKDIKEIAIDFSNPYILDSVKNGDIQKIINLAKEKGIKITPFESNRFGGGELEQLTKSQLTDIWNKANGKANKK